MLTEMASATSSDTRTLKLELHVVPAAEAVMVTPLPG